MSRKKVGLSAELKFRMTDAEKDLLRRAAVRNGVDMSVYCRSVLVDHLINDPTQREQLVAFQQTVVSFMDHVLRTRALVNADLQHRYSDHDLATVVAMADDLQAAWTGVVHHGDEEDRGDE